LRDLTTLKFHESLSVSGVSIEFNVLGVGHEFWIAVQAELIIGLTVLAREGVSDFRILHLEVAASRKKEGIGSALVKAIIRNYPQCTLSVIPFQGTEEFYAQLGFFRIGRWEMRYSPDSSC
jgi:GNAT superfamily N-acetyltransferase